MDSQSLLAVFMGKPVAVDTPVGPVTGVLAKAGKSRHGGIGPLLLQTPGSWILVKNWLAIKRA